ncbi:hypothetical protein HWV62_12362 [Athelia sp. TMB]|nr:hypothetical protein HWV62_12362 [Athelia sp. TMB]
MKGQAEAIDWYDRECVPYAKAIRSHLECVSQQGKESELLQSLAQNVETFKLGTNTDKYTPGLKQILRDGNINGGSNWSINQKSQVITKFMLLERIATALGYTASDKFTGPRKPSTKSIHDKLASVVKAVDNWFPAYEAIHKHVTNGDSFTDGALTMPDPGNLSEVQRSELRQLTLLLNGRQSQNQAEYLMAEGNLQYLAFMVQWHCMHNEPFPAEKTEFFDELLRACEHCHVPDSLRNTLTSMTGDDRLGFFTAVTSALDIAVHLSPLTMLTRLPGARFHMKRDIFFEWCRALGPKPAFVKQAEDGMWKMIMKITFGKPVREALASFVVDCNESFQLLGPQRAALRAHFVNGCLKDGVTAVSEPLATSTDGETPSGISHEAHRIEVSPEASVQNPSATEDDSIGGNDDATKTACTAESPDLTREPNPPENAESGKEGSHSIPQPNASPLHAEPGNGSAPALVTPVIKKAVVHDVPPAASIPRREIKPVHKFSSNQTLSSAPPSKKRKTNTGKATAVAATESAPMRLVAKHMPAQELQMFWKSADRLLFNASHH